MLLIGISVGLSIIIIIRTVRPGHASALERSLRKVRSVPSAVVRPSGTGVNFSEQDMTPFRAFDRYLDSMKGSDSGRRWYDSLVRARPGLEDSVGRVQHFLYFYQLLK